MKASSEQLLSEIFFETDVFFRFIKYMLNLITNPGLKKDFLLIMNAVGKQNKDQPFLMTGRLFSNLSITYQDQEQNALLPDFAMLEKTMHLDEILQNREFLETFLTIYNQEDLQRKEKITTMEETLQHIFSQKFFMDELEFKDKPLMNLWTGYWESTFESAILEWKSQQKIGEKICFDVEEKQFKFNTMVNLPAYQSILKAMSFYITSIIASVNDARHIDILELPIISLPTLQLEDIYKQKNPASILSIQHESEAPTFYICMLKQYGFNTITWKELPVRIHEDQKKYGGLQKWPPVFLHVDNQLFYKNERNDLIYDIKLTPQGKKALKAIRENVNQLSLNELTIISSIIPKFIPEYVIQQLPSKLYGNHGDVLTITDKENADIYHAIKGCAFFSCNLPELKTLRAQAHSVFVWTPKKELFYYDKWRDLLRTVFMSDDNKKDLEARIIKGDFPANCDLLCSQDKSRLYGIMACDKQFPVDPPEKPLPKEKPRKTPIIELPGRHNASDLSPKSEMMSSSSPRKAPFKVSFHKDDPASRPKSSSSSPNPSPREKTSLPSPRKKYALFGGSDEKEKRDKEITLPEGSPKISTMAGKSQKRRPSKESDDANISPKKQQPLEIKDSAKLSPGKETTSAAVHFFKPEPVAVPPTENNYLPTALRKRSKGSAKAKESDGSTPSITQ